MSWNDLSDRRAIAGASRAGRALAGPALIVACVLVVLWDFAFQGLLSDQHPDLIQYWLPFHCFLGKSLAAGHIPAWNAFAAGGAPFAADPQSGWMYLPAMALYSVAPCHTALGMFIVLQPVLGGLGLYWFLRAEDLSRPAATVGGLVIALMISGSTVALELPFSGSLAWTALMLAAAARCLRGSTWPRRLGWVAACAGCWGQIAGAHLTHGLAMGTGALGVYLAARLLRDLRRGDRRWSQALAIVGLILVALPLVNLAVLLPRLAYLPRTALALGYRGLAVRAAQLAGHPDSVRSIVGSGSDAASPLSLMASAGVYLGAVASAVSLAALWDRRLRTLAIGFVLFGLAGWALSLRAVESKLAGPLGSLPFYDVYEHAPARLSYATRLAVAVLAGLGVEAWLRAASPVRRGLMLASGLALWWLGAALVGRFDPGPGLLALGLAGGALALVVSTWRPRLAVLLPAVVALELTLNGVWGETSGAVSRSDSDHVPTRAPTVAGAEYVQPQPIERFLQARPGLRYATLAPGGLDLPNRSLLVRSPTGWNAAADQRSMLFGLADVDVYNPTQSLRYWSLVRAVSRGLREPKYNAGYFTRPSPVAFDLLDVGWVVTREGSVPAAGATPVLSSSGWALYRVPAPPRASVFTSWTAAPGPDAALATVTGPGFVPGARLVVEGWPARSGAAAGGTAVYRPTGPQSALVEVTTDAPSVVLIRNPYDPHWRATVDGRPVRVLPADYLDQGVPVPAGSHVVEVTYEDPTIGIGLLGSGVSLGLLFGLALAIPLRTGRGRAVAEGLTHRTEAEAAA